MKFSKTPLDEPKTLPGVLQDAPRPLQDRPGTARKRPGAPKDGPREPQEGPKRGLGAVQEDPTIRKIGFQEGSWLGPFLEAPRVGF